MAQKWKTSEFSEGSLLHCHWQWTEKWVKVVNNYVVVLLLSQMTSHATRQLGKCGDFVIANLITDITADNEEN